MGENHVVGGASGALARSGVSTSVWFQEEAEVDVEELEPLQGYPHLLIEMRRKNQWRSPRRQTREHIDCVTTEFSDTTQFQNKRTTQGITPKGTQANQTAQVKSAIERSKKWKERDKSMPKVGAGIMPAHDSTLNNNASQWNSVLLFDVSRDILKDIFKKDTNYLSTTAASLLRMSHQPPPLQQQN